MFTLTSTSDVSRVQCTMLATARAEEQVGQRTASQGHPPEGQFAAAPAGGSAATRAMGSTLRSSMEERKKAIAAPTAASAAWLLSG